MATLSALSTSDPQQLHILQRVRRWCRYRRALRALFADIDDILIAEHATGRLMLHYSQGAVAMCEFEEEAQLSSHPSDPS